MSSENFDITCKTAYLTVKCLARIQSVWRRAGGSPDKCLAKLKRILRTLPEHVMMFKSANGIADYGL